MKKGNKQALKIAKGVIRIVSLYVLTSAVTLVTPGFKGKYKRNEIKLFNTGILRNYTPFGNKEYLTAKLKILEEKSKNYDLIDSLDCGYINNLSEDGLITLRNNALATINELDLQEKKLRAKKRKFK